MAALTYARNNAPVLAEGPFWRKTLPKRTNCMSALFPFKNSVRQSLRAHRKWLPPIKLSRHVPRSAFP